MTVLGALSYTCCIIRFMTLYQISIHSSLSFHECLLVIGEGHLIFFTTPVTTESFPVKLTVVLKHWTAARESTSNLQQQSLLSDCENREQSINKINMM